jgi:hypothetical protein
MCSEHALCDGTTTLAILGAERDEEGRRAAALAPHDTRLERFAVGLGPTGAGPWTGHDSVEKR